MSRWICKWEDMQRWGRDTRGECGVHRGERRQRARDGRVRGELLGGIETSGSEDSWRDRLNQSLKLVHPVFKGSGTSGG
jgi:hypothetical protein